MSTVNVKFDRPIVYGKEVRKTEPGTVFISMGDAYMRLDGSSVYNPDNQSHRQTPAMDLVCFKVCWFNPETEVFPVQADLMITVDEAIKINEGSDYDE